jgi:LAGLIDADG DNA endonuclease family
MYRIRVRFGQVYYSLEFNTRNLSCFNELYSRSLFISPPPLLVSFQRDEKRGEFYLNGVKIIPENIYDLLTPEALAHLIMGDGSAKSHGLILLTPIQCRILYV